MIEEVIDPSIEISQKQTVLQLKILNLFLATREAKAKAVGANDKDPSINASKNAEKFKVIDAEIVAS